MATVTFITTELPATARKAYRLNLTPMLSELAELNLWQHPDDLYRWLELHANEVVRATDENLVPGGTYTLVVAEFSDFTLHGYVKNEIYHWSTITRRNISGVIHTAAKSYQDLIYTDDAGDANADMPHKQNPNALLVGVDAKPLLDVYALLDSRFILTHGRYITPYSHRNPINWVLDVCKQTWYQYQANSDYNLPLTTPSEYAHPTNLLELVDQLYRNDRRGSAIDFTNLDEDVSFIETDEVDDSTIDRCLASLTDPSITYDEDLWLHNVGQVEQLLSAIAATHP